MGGSSGASGFELRGADCGNRHSRSLQSSMIGTGRG